MFIISEITNEIQQMFLKNIGDSSNVKEFSSSFPSVPSGRDTTPVDFSNDRGSQSSGDAISGERKRK